MLPRTSSSNFKLSEAGQTAKAELTGVPTGPARPFVPACAALPEVAPTA
jgi:hypothetical protein